MERITLFTVLAKMETATTESEVEGSAFVLNRIEAQKHLSMAYEGKEMSDHKKPTLETGVKGRQRSLPKVFRLNTT